MSLVGSFFKYLIGSETKDEINRVESNIENNDRTISENKTSVNNDLSREELYIADEFENTFRKYGFKSIEKKIKIMKEEVGGSEYHGPNIYGEEDSCSSPPQYREYEIPYYCAKRDNKRFVYTMEYRYRLRHLIDIIEHYNEFYKIVQNKEPLYQEYIRRKRRQEKIDLAKEEIGKMKFLHENDNIIIKLEEKEIVDTLKEVFPLREIKAREKCETWDIEIRFLSNFQKVVFSGTFNDDNFFSSLLNHNAKDELEKMLKFIKEEKDSYIDYLLKNGLSLEIKPLVIETMSNHDFFPYDHFYGRSTKYDFLKENSKRFHQTIEKVLEKKTPEVLNKINNQYEKLKMDYIQIYEIFEKHLKGFNEHENQSFCDGDINRIRTIIEDDEIDLLQFVV